MIDLGSGYELEPYTANGMQAGWMIMGPASQHCQHKERCGGLIPTVPILNRPFWQVTREKPLSLTPSVRCSCDLKHPGEGQHGFITDGRWVNAGGIVAPIGGQT